jgi:DNA invertase Pin-like site-specific DNA recombinase
MPTAASSWSAPTSGSEVHRRAAGRTKYNSVRRFKADLRRVEVQKLFAQYGFARGARARIARELGVDRSTVSRDIRRLWAPDGETCPTCERMMTHREWKQLEDDRPPRLSDLVAL